MRLSGQQRKEILEALVSAFPTKSSLEQMLSFGLDKNLDAIAGGNNLHEIVFALIKASEAQGWIQKLISAAYKANPGNRLLSAVAAEVKSIEGKKSCFCQAPPLPAYFVERPEYSQELKNCLLAESTDVHTLVITAIHGLGSVGKSTLAAALAHDKDVQAHFCDGILWATLGQQPNLLSLVSGWIQTLGDYNFKATSVEAASLQLRTLLYDKAVLLVVDDAWNTEDAQAFNVGGARCQVLVTTREAAIAKVLKATIYTLDIMKPDQAIQLLSKKLERELTGTEKQEAQSLAKAVGYLPLALELAAAQVCDGTSWEVLLQDIQREIARLKSLDAPEAKDINDEASLKSLSLTASLSLSVQRLPEEEKQNFIWLGILPEDVTITPKMAATLWNMEDERNASLTLEYLRSKALLLAGVSLGDGTRTYRLHDLFHDLALNLLTSPSTPKHRGDLPGLNITLAYAHTTLLEKYRQKTQNGLWHTLPGDGYIHQHLVWHLEKAQKVEEIHELLREESKTGGNGWYEVCERLGQTANFITNVVRAWQLAEKEWTEITLPQVIGLQCRYALIIASLNSLATNLPVGLLVALVQKNVWTLEQGLAYVRQCSNPAQKVNFITQLANDLPPNLKELGLLKPLAAARELQDESNRADALSSLAPILPPELLPEALAAARELRFDEYRADALSSLAPILPPELLPEALAAARELQNEYSRAKVLSSLAPILPPELLPEALATARSIQNQSDRAKVLSSLADKLPAKLLLEALAAARSIQDEYSRAYALSSLADKLPELLPEALATARSIQDEYSRAYALSIFADKMQKMLPESLAAARELQDESNRADPISSLAPILPLDLLSEALAAARELQDESNRAKALSSLAPILPPDLLPESLAAARELQDESNRADPISSLAPILPLDLLSEALAAARELQDESNRAKALSSLAPILPPDLLPEALAAARELQNESNRAKALSSLAPILPPDLLPEALAAARELQNEYSRAKALSSLAPILPPDLLPEALAAARELWFDSNRADALSSLADQLPELLPEALAAARSIQDESNRAKALSSLAPILPPDLLPEALAAARSIQDESNRAKALSSLADKLSQIQKTPLFEHWRDTLHILSVHTRPNLLSDISALTPVIFTLGGQQAVKDTATAIQDVSRWWG